MPFCKSTVNIIFKNKDNSIKKVKAKIGQNLLAIAHENDIDLEGACEASLACSTCHVILQRIKVFDSSENIFKYNTSDTRRGRSIGFGVWLDRNV